MPSLKLNGSITAADREDVQELAKTLRFEHLDSRTYEALTVFLQQLPEGLSPEQIRDEFLKFEDTYLDLGLLEQCDLPVGYMNAGVHMNRDIVTIEASEPVISLSRRLLRRMVSGAPVVDDDGRLVGVVSTTDIVGVVARPERLEKVQELCVGDIMTTYTITATVQTSILEVLRTLLSFRLHRVIVVDRNNKPVGLISALDITKILNHVLQELREQMRKP